MNSGKSDIELIASGGYVTIKIHNPIQYEGGHAGVIMKWPEAVKIHWALMETILGSVDESQREEVISLLTRMPAALKSALAKKHGLN